MGFHNSRPLSSSSSPASLASAWSCRTKEQMLEHIFCEPLFRRLKAGQLPLRIIQLRVGVAQLLAPGSSPNSSATCLARAFLSHDEELEALCEANFAAVPLGQRTHHLKGPGRVCFQSTASQDVPFICRACLRMLSDESGIHNAVLYEVATKPRKRRKGQVHTSGVYTTHDAV